MTAEPATIHCPICQREVAVTPGPDDISSGRCACGVRLMVIETPAEDGLPVRQVVAQRRQQLGNSLARRHRYDIPDDRR